jgi:hypothetical protein
MTVSVGKPILPSIDAVHRRDRTTMHDRQSAHGFDRLAATIRIAAVMALAAMT